MTTAIHIHDITSVELGELREVPADRYSPAYCNRRLTINTDAGSTTLFLYANSAESLEPGEEMDILRAVLA
jgi:hypothetical protein